MRVSVWSRSSDSETDWAHVTNFGIEGSGVGQFNGPLNCALTPDDLTLLVVDDGNARICVWSRQTTSSTEWTNVSTFGDRGSTADQFSNPYGVSVTSNGLNAYITDGGNNRVSIWGRSSVGSTQWTNVTTIDPSTTGTGLRNGALTADDLWFLFADLQTDSAVVLNRPDASGNSWSLQTPFGSGGIGAGQFLSPDSIAISSDGQTAYITDASAHFVSIWSRSSSSSNDWAYVTQFGTYGSDASNIRSPHGIALHGGQVFVADSGNSRVSVWHYA